MPTTLTNGIQLPDKGSVDWYNSMQSNYNLIDTHLGNTDIHVTAEDKANWDSKQGSLSQTQLDAIAQVATNTSDIASLQSGKADVSHTHSSSDITDIGDYATKQYVDTSISGLVDNAPDALNTLNELSAALNDDSNFATTVTTALSAKANSADLATVATSGDYDDLDNKPDLNPYDQHLANTDIHVTAADKQKWNDNVNQSYVLRYASTSVTPSSTISYSVLNNTDNIKAGDSVIDASGQVFLIASVNSANQTVTVSAVLLTLALDANVMHVSGNETVAGIKTFSDNTFIKSLNFTNEAASPSSSEGVVMPIVTTVTYTDQSPSKTARLNFRISANGDKSLFPHENNQYALGLTTRKWSEVHGVTYYYGSSDVEFSQKFVTTDTAQTIGGVKTFSDIPIFTSFDGIRFRCAHNSNAYVTFRNSNQANPGSIIFSANDGNVSTSIHLVAKTLIPYNTADIDLGTSLRKWKSFNGINPGALSLPDLNNALDISGYITRLDKVVNNYTPPSNGWLSIRVKKTSLPHSSLMMYQPGGLLSSCETDEYSISGTNLPVIANQNVEIYVYADVLVEAKFFPCQGNV